MRFQCVEINLADVTDQRGLSRLSVDADRTAPSGSGLLGTAGVVSGSAARSAYRGVDDSQVSLGYQWNDSRFSFGFNGIRSTSGYRGVATLYGTPPPRLYTNAARETGPHRSGKK